MKVVSLGEICDLQNGYAFKSSDYVSFSNTLNCRMSNVRPNGKFDVEYAPKYLPDEYANTYSNFLLRDGDIVIAMTDMANDPKILGVPTIVDTKGKKMLLNQRVGKLILLEENQVNISYLQYSLNRTSVKKYYTQFAGGGLQLNVGKKEILSVKIPLPPLPTQQKIASILDAADTLRQKDKALLAKYDELTQSLFLDMFGDPVSNPKGWEKKEFKEYTLDVKNGITRRPKSEEDNSGDKVLKLKNIRSNFINYDCENRIMLVESEKQKFDVKIGDLLFIRVNGNPDYVGRCALHNDINQEVYYNDHIMRVRYNLNYYNGLFLSQYLNYPYGQSEISKQIKTSAGQHTINQGGLEKLNLIIPPIELQNQFAERVKAIEIQKAIAQASLEKSEELFNSLLQKAFKGVLV